MDTRIDEIEDRIYRISTYTAEGPPGGITFNQFLVDAEEPLLVHTGMRVHFADTLTAARRNRLSSQCGSGSIPARSRNAATTC